eukprot:TRINITY_DN31059_c0_g1_i1.p1 TRINITY_DN31059_c0_g1~~TRINITY_DN31059_c0_g1_i1.p1  ORF type:complete len:298 (+),score=59.89 TRINITY_DN31059_c0_g1_i1:46-939(+)
MGSIYRPGDDIEKSAVFLAGSATDLWREKVEKLLNGVGINVINPVNDHYADLTKDQHQQQCNWELTCLDNWDLVKPVFWFGKSASTVSLFELGFVVGRRYDCLVMVTPDHPNGKEIIPRLHALGVPAANICDNEDDLIKKVLSSVKESPKPPIKPGRDCVGVGCGAFIFDDKKRVLLIKRSQNAKSEPGTWARPGGAVEMGETVEEALVREMREEVGLEITNPRLLDVTTQTTKGANWVAIGYIVNVKGDPLAATNKEPHKHDDLQWFSLNNLPTPIASFVKQALQDISEDPDKYLN